MAVSMAKGFNVSLSKQAPGLTAVTVGLGWDTRVTDGSAFDLDASVFLLGDTGPFRSDTDFVFYNNTTAAGGAVEHQGDNLTGEGAGDDEVVQVALERPPPEVARLSFAVTVHEAEARRQNFGIVSNAFIRVLNVAGGTEIARYDLSEDASTETAIIFGELYCHGAEWKFEAIGQGFAGGLGRLAQSFGVNV